MDDNNPHFVLGMTFIDSNEVRDAIARYSIAQGHDLKLKPNERWRIRAKCKQANCPFVMLISKDGNKGGMSVKHFN